MENRGSKLTDKDQLDVQLEQQTNPQYGNVVNFNTTQSTKALAD